MTKDFNKVLRGFLVVVSVLVMGIGLKNSIQTIEHEKNVMGELQFVDEREGISLSYAAWEASLDSMYYLILPSAYKQQTVFEGKLSYDDSFYSIYIDDKEYANGEVWTEKLQEEIHRIKIVDFWGNIRMDKPFQVLVSEKIPTIMVTVEAKDALFSRIEYSNKQYVEKGDIIMLDEKGNVVLDESMERFKVRGNLTSTMEKKPFTFTLPKEVSLCGMSSGRNWHLIANATDGSHIRNKIMLEWAKELTEGYQPTGEFVDFYLNGEYQGLYYLTEPLEVAQNRLELDTAKGVLLEMELAQRAVEENNYLATNREHYWVAHSDSFMSQEILKKIKNYLNEIESALYSEDGVSEISQKSLPELLDYDTWTDTWLLKEVSSDHDLGTTSQFGVVEDLEKGSIFLAGPEWDFDGTLGNGMVPWAQNPRNLVTAIRNVKGIESVSQNKWLAQMYCHEDFKQMLIQKFEEEVQPKIARLLEYEIDEYAEEIHRSALLDSLRWNGNGICNYFAYPENFSFGTQEDYRKYDVLECHLDMIKGFLREKNQFLQELWLDGVEFEVIIEEGMNLQLNNDIYTWIRKE